MHSTQVELIKGEKRQIVWIPSEYARVGALIKLRKVCRDFDGDRGFKGKWDDGWTVSRTFMTDFSAKVQDRSRDYRLTRVASDV